MGNVQYGSYLPKSQSDYTALSTDDPVEIIRSAPRSPMQRTMSGTEKSSKSKHSPHKESIGALSTVRPGMIITGSKDTNMSLINLDVGASNFWWKGHEKEVTKVVYKNAGGKHYVLSGSRDCTVKLWQFNQHEAETFHGHSLPIMGLAMIDNTHFISGSRDGSIKLWDLQRPRSSLRTETMNRNLVTHISYFSPYSLIAQSSEDKELKLWDTRTLDCIAQLPRRMHILTHCDFAPDGNTVVTSSNGFNGDGCLVSIWDVRQRKLLKDLKGHEESVTGVAHLPQQVTWKKLLVSVSLDRTLRVWNLDEGNCLWTENVPTGEALLAVTALSDGSVVTSGTDGFLAYYRLYGRAGRPYLSCSYYQTGR